MCGSSVLISKKVTCKSFKKVMIDILPVFVCVLTGLWTRKYDQIMRWWSSKPHSGIATVLEPVAYCYIRLPHLPCYSIPCLIYRMRSFIQPGVSCLCPIISAYRTCPPSIIPSMYHHSFFPLCITAFLFIPLRESLYL